MSFRAVQLGNLFDLIPNAGGNRSVLDPSFPPALRFSPVSEEIAPAASLATRNIYALRVR
jgi:hypothetical protein